MSNYAEIINARRLIEGPRNDLMAVSPMKHKWALEYWDLMLANNWTLHEVSLLADGPCYRNDLTEGERFAYDSALSFLSNLDGIQLGNLMNNIAQHITSPEVLMCITRQTYEEANHVMCYSALVETVSADPMAVYMRFERDGMLAKKNDSILRQSRILKETYSARAFALAVVGNVALEGIYFYSGFLNFYTLARRGKMVGSAEMIKFIQRDEVTHLHLFAQMFATLRVERPELFDAGFWADARELLRLAAEMEIEWGKYIIKGGVLGLTEKIVEDYIKALTNDRAALLGMDPIFPGVKDPCEWVKKFSSINGDERNFFETKVLAYQSANSLAWE
ncbi:ribonucleotide-diphosphate reductase subunit beta [Achromobacter sp. AGC39]